MPGYSRSDEYFQYVNEGLGPESGLRRCDVHRETRVTWAARTQQTEAVDTRERLLATYDDQLRTDAETPSALAVTRLGPLRLVAFVDGRGFVTYRDLGGADENGVRRLVSDALAHYEADPSISRVEWKTRGHDHAPGLHEALLVHGFVAEEPEAVMIGEAAALAVGTPLPDGVTLRQVREEHDVRATSQLQQEVYGDIDVEGMTRALMRRLSIDDGMQIWVAEAAGRVVCTGRLEPVVDTDVAGIWGGVTAVPWRGQGLYRAVTAVRARSAIRDGKRLLHSDSTEDSRPILERSGFVTVTTTTPYVWRRG